VSNENKYVQSEEKSERGCEEKNILNKHFLYQRADDEDVVDHNESSYTKLQKCCPLKLWDPLTF
jgi:hypothetical protein